MSEKVDNNRRLPLGQVRLTASAREVLLTSDVIKALFRHAMGDWGEAVSKADWEANNHALKYGERVISAYLSAGGTRFWIITEADRSYTTVLLPNDY